MKQIYFPNYNSISHKRFTGPCLKCTITLKLFLHCHWYCVCLHAGMAELHPEECRSSLYRVGQRRQVCSSDLLSAVLSLCSSTSSLSFQPLPIRHFPISPFMDQITVPQALKIPKALVMRCLFKFQDNNQWGGGLKRSLGECGWKILEFKAPFNTCSSQRDLGKGERLGRRWQGLWSLVPLWHLGNRSWFPTIPLPVSAFLSVAVFCFMSMFFSYPNVYVWASPSLPNKTLFLTSNISSS